MRADAPSAEVLASTRHLATGEVPEHSENPNKRQGDSHCFVEKFGRNPRTHHCAACHALDVAGGQDYRGGAHDRPSTRSARSGAAPPHLLELLSYSANRPLLAAAVAGGGGGAGGRDWGAGRGGGHGGEKGEGAGGDSMLPAQDKPYTLQATPDPLNPKP